MKKLQLPVLGPRGRYPAQLLQRVEIDFFATYFARIVGSEDSHAYRTVWAKVNEVKKDITEGGKKSCALFVSTILHGFDLVESVHTSVPGTVGDLEHSGWKKIPHPRLGAVVTWAGIQYGDGLYHAHMGFVTKKNEAMSMSDKTRTPIRHHLTYGRPGTKKHRPVMEIWWHPKLGK